MHLKRYRTRSVADALALARQELGPDALVLSTRLVGKYGWRGWAGEREVEVTVAADRQVSDGRPDRQETRTPMPPLEPGAEALVARLLASGLDEDTARAVAADVPSRRRRDAGVAAVQEALAACLRPLSAEDTVPAHVEVFVGPPGAGKTTTLAKIAAQARVRRGSRYSFVAADGFRVGAVEQLRLYADILGAPFAVARTAHELEDALKARRPLLVDTAGRSPCDAAGAPIFGVLAGRPDVRTHLVVPATSSAHDFTRTLDKYRVTRPDRIVLTRIDETETLSPLVPALRDAQLPISYLGTGQRVPEDLERSTADLLAACVLGEYEAVQGIGA
jgi:flagellar biosynthesis protein FlhF